MSDAIRIDLDDVLDRAEKKFLRRAIKVEMKLLRSAIEVATEGIEFDCLA
jgi:hypothetical protein